VDAAALVPTLCQGILGTLSLGTSLSQLLQLLPSADVLLLGHLLQTNNNYECYAMASLVLQGACGNTTSTAAVQRTAPLIRCMHACTVRNQSGFSQLSLTRRESWSFRLSSNSFRCFRSWSMGV
jgi:hypothetical protein